MLFTSIFKFKCDKAKKCLDYIFFIDLLTAKHVITMHYFDFAMNCNNHSEIKVFNIIINLFMDAKISFTNYLHEFLVKIEVNNCTFLSFSTTFFSVAE